MIQTILHKGMLELKLMDKEVPYDAHAAAILWFVKQTSIGAVGI